MICSYAGCYLKMKVPGPDICPSCAQKERRRLVRARNKRETPGVQWQLGITRPGRWCQRGCCDLDNPQSGDCRY